MISVLRDREFVKLWSGQTISEIGSRITREGLPYTAVKLLDASTAQMGLLAALQGVAAFAAGPLAGLAADRYHHRPILIASDLARALVLASIPWAYLHGQLTFSLLMGVAVAAAFLTVFFDVAYQAYLPRLLPKEQWLEGNGKLAISFSTAEVIGPGLTGVLIQVLTAPRAILLDALSFILSALSVALIRRPEILPPPKVESAHRQAAPSLRILTSHPILRALALRTATAFFSFGFLSSLYIYFAVRELHLSAAAIGGVVMLGGMSNLCGSLLAPRLLLTFPLGPLLIGSALLPGLAACLIPLAPSSSVWWGAAFLGASQLIGDLGFPVFGVHELTLRQSVTPPALLGRVNAGMQMLMKGLLPAGALIGGLLAESIGIRPTFALGAAGVLASTFFLYFSPIRHLRNHPEPVA